MIKPIYLPACPPLSGGFGFQREWRYQAGTKDVLTKTAPADRHTAGRNRHGAGRADVRGGASPAAGRRAAGDVGVVRRLPRAVQDGQGDAAAGGGGAAARD